MTARSKSIQQEHFDAMYRARRRGGSCHLHQAVISLLKARPIPEHSRVLDVGAGQGDLLGALPRTYRTFAVDISEVAVSQLAAKGIEATRIDLDVDDLPYDSETFDVVLCLEVLEHLIRPEEALREIRRTLKPTGTFIASVPNIYQLCTLALYVADIPPVNSARFGHVHVNDFTARLLKKALRENGFIVRRMAGDAIFPLTDPISRWVASKVPRLAHHLIAVCDVAP
ncbi:MAG: methyltransferase domain-containing protein [Thermoanaerobaculales bacterium]|jgi:2-polyprenyl-3-methyl-5-hydroxy-6-metoxy-1,4-benzoquinol methylase|nr:methyltransferase domain-containing protein [Thermoanaerobaculales bacterium]